MIIKFGIVFLPGLRFSSRALSNCGERARLAQSKKSLKSGLITNIEITIKPLVGLQVVCFIGGHALLTGAL